METEVNGTNRLKESIFTPYVKKGPTMEGIARMLEKKREEHTAKVKAIGKLKAELEKETQRHIKATQTLLTKLQDIYNDFDT